MRLTTEDTAVPNHSYLPGLGLLLATLALLSAPADAADSYDGCTGFIDALPAVVTQQGVYCLRRNLVTAHFVGPAIDIRANNVTFDCNHFSIDGLAGVQTLAEGIYAQPPDAVLPTHNITVRNCTVRGFLKGIRLWGNGHVIEDNLVETSTLYGIDVSGDATVVRRNRVLDTGASRPLPAGILARGVIDLVDNTIHGVVVTGGDVHGISAESLNGTIAGNRVHGLLPDTGYRAIGIFNSGNGRLVIRDNDLGGSGRTGLDNGTGIYCASGRSVAAGNIISGFTFDLSNCTAAGNMVVP